MANDWFTWKGVSSKVYGIRVLELPPISIAQERMTYEKIAGRSGSLAMPEGDDVYEDVTLSCTCMLTDKAMLDRAMGWLRGSGKLTFANRSNGYYEARVSNQIDLNKIITTREERQFTLSFRAQPYFYITGVEDIELTASGETINNPYSIASAPRIMVYGSGDVGLSIGGQLMVLKNLDGGILLDTALQDALTLDGSGLLNNQAAGDFPIIPSGTSMVSWYAFDEDDNPGTVTKIVISPRWRCR